MTTNTTAKGYLQDIAGALSSNKFGEAEILARQALDTCTDTGGRAEILHFLAISLWNRGQAREAKPRLDEALSLALEVQDKNLQAKILSELGVVACRLSDFTASIEYNLQSITLYELIGDKAGVAKNKASMGVAYEYLCEYQEALTCYKESLCLQESLGNEKGVAGCYSNMGIVYAEMAEYSNALEYHQKSLAIREQLNDKVGMAISFGNIGTVYQNLGKYNEALTFLKKALLLNEELDRKNGVATNLGNLAFLYRQLGDDDKSYKYFLQAVEVGEEMGDKYFVANAALHCGIVLERMKNYELSLEYLQKALALSQEIGNEAGIGEIFGSIAATYIGLEQYDTAFTYLVKGIAHDEKLEIKHHLAALYQGLGSLYADDDFSQYNVQKSEEYLLRATAIAEELGMQHFLRSNYKNLADFYESIGNIEKAYFFFKKFYDVEKDLKTTEAQNQLETFSFERQIALMEREREVTDMLLHKFLPSPIVSEVKSKEGKILVEKYDCVSVLFADLVGFTKLTLMIPPETMIEMLNFIFTKFDTIIKEEGGHRIRTIGDGYFAVCGAPDKIEEHQYRLAKAAVRLMEDIILPDSIKKHLPKGTELDIRIGIHCGEAVCGMVGGLEKWQYDIYGDTVNTASRMESYGEPGKIHISDAFKVAIERYGEFAITPREPVFIKGKGMMNTYFIH